MLAKAGGFVGQNQPQPLFAALAAGQKTHQRSAELNKESCPTSSPDLRSAIRKKINNDSCASNSKKKVSFWPMAYVVLIPTTDEYYKAGLASDLWWNEHDYKTFKRGALQDLQTFLLKNPQLDPKAAVKLYFHHVEDGRLLDSPLQSFHNNNNPVTMVPLNDLMQNSSSSADQKTEKRESHVHSTEKTETSTDPSPESKGHHTVRFPEKASIPSIPTKPSITAPPQVPFCSGSSSSSSFEVLDLFSKVASMMLGSVVQDE